jgi:hypothetical protein
VTRSHDWIDRRSLALHEAVASKLESDPAVLEVARRNVRRWRGTNPSPVLDEWSRVLDAAPIPDIVALLRSTDDEAVRLRRSSPFAGVLSGAERRSILAQYESRRP